ncbi:hypothetical protein ANO14919_132150 [Xylariales sp. No.14919]|nr:hypothetical protein ANO14919_132150 [Xylariales sp. No.14919]
MSDRERKAVLDAITPRLTLEDADIVHKALSCIKGVDESGEAEIDFVKLAGCTGSHPDSMESTWQSIKKKLAAISTGIQVFDTAAAAVSNKSTNRSPKGITEEPICQCRERRLREKNNEAMICRGKLSPTWGPSGSYPQLNFDNIRHNY